jgi:hypothetical protein
MYGGFEWKQLQPTGFAKHGSELWWLAQTMLKLALSENTPYRFSSGTPTDTLGELHHLIRKHAG